MLSKKEVGDYAVQINTYAVKHYQLLKAIVDSHEELRDENKALRMRVAQLEILEKAHTADMQQFVR